MIINARYVRTNSQPTTKSAKPRPSVQVAAGKFVRNCQLQLFMEAATRLRPAFRGMAVEQGLAAVNTEPETSGVPAVNAGALSQ